MSIARTSSAADLMNILTKTSKNDEIQENSFAEIFKQLLQNSNVSASTFSETSSDSGFFHYPRYAGNPTTEYNNVKFSITCQTSWRNSEAYAQIRDNILNAKGIEFTEDMLEATSEENFLNGKGREYERKWRVEKLMPVTPSSIEEVNNRYTVSIQHLNDYIHTQLVDNGIQTELFMDPFYNGNISSLGLQRFFSDDHAASYREFLMRPEGQEIKVMSEEVAFYGAIAKMAAKDPTFHLEFNNDPIGTIDKYYSYIAEEMENIKLPHINTIQKDKILIIS